MLFYQIFTPCSRTGIQNCTPNMRELEMNLLIRGLNGVLLFRILRRTTIKLTLKQLRQGSFNLSKASESRFHDFCRSNVRKVLLCTTLHGGKMVYLGKNALQSFRSRTDNDASTLYGMTVRPPVRFVPGIYSIVTSIKCSTAAPFLTIRK